MSGKKPRNDEKLINKDAWEALRVSSSVNEAELFQKHYLPLNCEFDRQPETAALYGVTGGPICPNYGLSGVACSSTEARGFLARHDTHGSMFFHPIVGYEREDDVMLIGKYAGNTQAWMQTINENNFWDVRDGTCIRLGERVRKVGKQILEILTKLHQDGRFVGTLRKSLSIDPQTSKVTIITIGDQNLTLVDGIKQDIADFRSFMDEIYPRSFGFPVEYQLFKSFFKTDFLFRSENEIEVKAFSYLLCHFPLFWEFGERHKFAEIMHYIRKNNYFLLVACLKLDKGVTDFTQWETVIVSRNDEYNEVYKFTQSEIPEFTTVRNQHRLISFIRNCFNHIMGTKTLRQVDEELLTIFPGVYSKIYYDFCSHMKCSEAMRELTSISPSLNYAETEE